MKLLFIVVLLISSLGFSQQKVKSPIAGTLAPIDESLIKPISEILVTPDFEEALREAQEAYGKKGPFLIGHVSRRNIEARPDRNGYTLYYFILVPKGEESSPKVMRFEVPLWSNGTLTVMGNIRWLMGESREPSSEAATEFNTPSLFDEAEYLREAVRGKSWDDKVFFSEFFAEAYLEKVRNDSKLHGTSEAIEAVLRKMRLSEYDIHGLLRKKEFIAELGEMKRISFKNVSKVLLKHLPR